MKIVLYVQHLLGTGHLVRTRLIADALHQQGHDVTLISGGPVSQDRPFSIVQLPVLKTADGDFTTLLDNNNDVADKSYKQQRKELLLRTLNSLSPDVLVMETWPFGRKQLEFEILPLMEELKTWKQQPLIVCSIREVLQQRKPPKRQRTLEQIKKYFSLILVHGDENIISLNESFPETECIQSKVTYTGYISASDMKKIPPRMERNNEIVVSAGGGAAGLSLLQTAKRCCESTAHEHDEVWRLLVGPNLDEETFQNLKRSHCNNLIVERNRKDFPDLLEACKVSISQFGYNTALDLDRAQCPAVVVPYEADGETEQLMRANCFAQLNRVVVVTERDLSPQSLRKSVSEAQQKCKTRTNTWKPINANGAVNSAKIVYQHYQDNL